MGGSENVAADGRGHVVLRQAQQRIGERLIQIGRQPFGVM
jgi:hypothetical protein